MSALAALAQLIASKAVDDRHWRRRDEPVEPGVRVRCEVDATARVAVISPSPAARGFPLRTARAVRIRAPLTWSGVQLGWRASISATVPETTGAANDVPESWM